MFGISAFAQSTFASLSVEDVTVALTGDAASGAVGTARVSVSVALTGVTSSGFVGIVTPSESVGETGDVATGFVGTVTPSTAIALTGVAASGAVGTVTHSKTVAISGVSATGNVGTVGVAKSLALTGLSASGVIGSIGKYYWLNVEDAQTPNWTEAIKSVTIDDVAVFGGGIFAMSPFAGGVKQTYVPSASNWIVIDTAETADWTLINATNS